MLTFSWHYIFNRKLMKSNKTIFLFFYLKTNNRGYLTFSSNIYKKNFQL